ncbi:Palmitoyltransferase [Coemansia spiralis]|uniref:Palmitoyltransferase n=2 Tax=Coemansia TaxID=4863 RepID=A0A9W8G8K9_9FUNG|nr:DHHC palmitoyltransferase-domain-containing protein [Coemansia spiralis]KAJ1995424.1 Palmitoyltransferase [Coemansia umbellata]KAJ2624747.1 Palmitoyltransferase [Coemansia sp. RSA 1358]KAJ2678290.1 Palmitoyltransferase [Coemansia spiralis]
MTLSAANDSAYDAEFDVGKLYVWGVSILIGFIGYSSQIFVFWGYLGGPSLKALFVLGVFNFLLHLLYYNYYLAATVEPGHVPLGWEPPRDGANVYELKRDTLKPRYCRLCKGFKPPRTHHCSDCDRCVLKMDHHCPWTNNCVGFNNQAHFLRFVYTVDVTCAMAILLHSLRLYELVIDSLNGTYYVRQPTQTEVAFLIINITLASLVLLFVGILSGYHLYLVGNNTTTIESREKDRVARLIKSKKCKPTPYPYDLGIVRNFKSVFGNNVLLWWVPKRAVGTGLNFPIKEGLTPPVYWPPPGYSREVSTPDKIEQRCNPMESKTIYSGPGGVQVVAEVDDDGETVIRQYSQSTDPAALECGGQDGGYRERAGNGAILTGFFDSGKEDKSESGEGDWDNDDDDYDSDDDFAGVQPTSLSSGVSLPGRPAIPGAPLSGASSTLQKRNVFGASRQRSSYGDKLADYTRTGPGANDPNVSNANYVDSDKNHNNDDDDDNIPLLHAGSRKPELQKTAA